MSNTEHTAPTILSNNYRLPFLQGGFPTYGVMPEVLDQMVHIDASRNILYFEVPKAGCSGIKKYMISMAGGTVNLERLLSLSMIAEYRLYAARHNIRLINGLGSCMARERDSPSFATRTHVLSAHI